MKEIVEVQEEARRCVKCGNCLAQCPVYQETLEEPLAARGKMALVEALKQEDTEFTRRFSKILSQCLLCGTCSENCPNGVTGDEIIREARSLLVKGKGLSLPKKAIFKYFLDSDHLMNLAMKVGAAVQPLLMEKIPEESGLRLRFPLPLLDRRRFIPQVAAEPFLNARSGWVRAEKEVMRVGMFTGCVSNYLFPRVAGAALDLYVRNGISVYIPPEQKCCGLPAFGSGDEETPRSLARKNIEAFSGENLDEVVAHCASCAAMLKLDYPLLFEESDPFRVKAVEFSKMVSDSSAFLSRVPELKLGGNGRGGEAVRVTYHDPCHLRRKLGISEEPRNLLKNAPGVEYVEMRDANRCCGQGGSFNILNYDLSLKILDRKTRAIEESGADVITTTCSGCMLQLMDGLHQAGAKNREVRHLVEMINQATII
ncbi:MAG TPA: (Fe-S)-binding protein [Thermodesulfobacteriota bacterium]|nr:(Fe-S)-binding protein [Thermodesulfobacteriota bacterium]